MAPKPSRCVPSMCPTSRHVTTGARLFRYLRPRYVPYSVLSSGVGQRVYDTFVIGLGWPPSVPTTGKLGTRMEFDTPNIHYTGVLYRTILYVVDKGLLPWIARARKGPIRILNQTKPALPAYGAHRGRRVRSRSLRQGEGGAWKGRGVGLGGRW